MKSSWTAGANPEEKKIIEGEFKGSAAFRKMLTERLDKDIQSRLRTGRSEELYDSPNWGLRQADVNGYLRALEHVISLIK